MFSSNIVANVSRLFSVYILYAISAFVVPKIIKPTSDFAKIFKKNYIVNGFIVIFVYTFMEEYMLILLQFTHVNFESALNIVGFVVAIILSLHIIFMIVVYLKKAQEKMNYFNEEDLRKYRVFFMMFPSNHLYNKLYMLLIMICKVFVLTSVICDNSIFIKTGIVFVGIFFLEMISHKWWFDSKRKKSA